MSFNPSIPLVGDFLSISQKQILANFQAINESFFTDHVSLTAVEDVGKHKTLTLRPQGSDPTTSATQCAMYNKLVSTIPQLFYRPNTNGTPIQLSNENLNTIQTGATASNQSTFIAGPFTIYVGFVANASNGDIVTLTPSSTLIDVNLTTWLTQGVMPGLASTATPTAISGNQFTIAFNDTAGGIPAAKKPTIYYTAVGI